MKTRNIVIGAVLFAALASQGAIVYAQFLNLRVRGNTLFGSAVDSDAVADSHALNVDWHFAASTIVCTDAVVLADGGGFELAGVLPGDPCFVGIGPADGGIQNVAANSTFSCISELDAVKLRHCAAGTAVDPADAGYQIRVFSSRP